MNHEHRLITLIKSGEGPSLEFKNPVLGAFFREIHRADELGSGMRNMMKYGQAYGGDDTRLIEGDVFRIFVKVPEFGAVDNSQEQKEATKQGGPVRAQSGAQSQKILQALARESLSAVSLAGRLGLHSKTGSLVWLKLSRGNSPSFPV